MTDWREDDRAEPVDLVCFHHAGGSAAVYTPITHHVPANWRVTVPDYPGRGRQHGSVTADHVEDIVDYVLDELPAQRHVLALFGHSLGAIVAVEVARRLETADPERGPVWVGVSGRVGPSYEDRGEALLDGLDDDAVLRAVLAENSGSRYLERLAAIPAMRRRLLDTLRADLRVAARYRPHQDRRCLRSPIATYVGRRDTWVPAQTIDDWRSETTGRFTSRIFEGGHFYFLENGLFALARAIEEDVYKALSRRVV